MALTRLSLGVLLPPHLHLPELYLLVVGVEQQVMLEEPQ